jgi:hypothetical protein
LDKTNSQKYQLTIEQTKEGLPTISVRDYNNRRVYLHSRLFPSRESEAFKDSFNPERFDALIVLGIGLGYHLTDIKEKIDKYKKIVLIDTLDNLANEIDKIPITRFLCNHRNIKLITGQSINTVITTVSQEVDFDEIKGILIIEHPQSMRIFPEYYQEIRKGLERIISKKASDKATKRAFGRLYLSNILKNLSILSEYYPVSSFFNCFDKYPALLITSGPSIEAYINEIKRHQQNLFIISVDSALPVLKTSQIIPDFCISIDPQTFIAEHFIGSNYTYLPVFSISSNHTVLSHQRGLVSLNSHPLSQIIEQLYPDTIGSIDSLTGSVAGDAINLARRLRFKNIGLLGYDFSFLDYKIYSRGTAYQKRFALYYHDRLHPIETHNYNYIIKASKGFIYRKRFSRRSFIHYKESLETMIQCYNIKNIYNINHAGIPIESVPNIDLQEFLRTYCSQKFNKSTIVKNILSGTIKIQKLISIQKIKEILLRDDILVELINASLEQSLDVNRANKIRQLIAKINP